MSVVMDGRNTGVVKWRLPKDGFDKEDSIIFSGTVLVFQTSGKSFEKTPSEELGIWLCSNLWFLLTLGLFPAHD